MELVISLLDALHANHHDKRSSKNITELVAKLAEFRCTVHESEREDYRLAGEIDEAAMEANAEVVDITTLDAQIKADPSILKFLSYEDLRSIAINHNVVTPDEGLAVN